MYVCECERVCVGECVHVCVYECECVCAHMYMPNGLTQAPTKRLMSSFCSLEVRLGVGYGKQQLSHREDFQGEK